MKHIQLPENVEFDPMLLVLINKLSLERPSWVFRPGMKPSQLDRESFAARLHSPYLNGQQEFGENIRFLRSVAIVENEQKLGTIAADFCHWGRHRNEFFWSIQSWRINNERGRTNTTTTTKLDNAVRTCKKVFVAKTYKEEWDRSTEKIREGFTNSVNQLRGSMYRLTRDLDDEDVSIFLHDTMLGRPVPTDVDARIRNKVATPKFNAAREEYELAVRMRGLHTSNRMAFVIERDGRFMYGIEDDAVFPIDFNHLPHGVQEKVSVLQLVENGEIVLDTGYRYQAGYYYVAI